MFCGTDIILYNILHIQYECEEYSTKYYQSHKTLCLDLNNVLIKRLISIYIT